MRKYLAVGVLAMVVGFAPAAAFALESLGLDDAETVWVPAGFHEDGQPALYIRGERYYGPDGNGVVPGFLRAGDQYLVAVGSAAAVDAQRSEPLYFYFVGRDGGTVEEVGRVPSTFEVRVGDRAIFGEQRGLRRALNFEGFDVEGRAGWGPGEILDAMPAPNGGWYVFDNYASSGDGRWISLEHISEIRQQRTLRRTHWHEDDVNGLFATTAVFADADPLADTIRTGRWIWLHGAGAAKEEGAGDEYGLRFLRAGEIVPGRVRGAPEDEPLIVGRADSPREAHRWAASTVLFERGDTVVAGQWNAEGRYGLYPVDGGAPEYIDAFGGDGEVRALITPRGTLLYKADGSAGYVVESGRVVDGAALKGALGRYGIALGE